MKARSLGFIDRKAPTRRTALYVIAIGADGPCKIGISKRPDLRLENLQVASPSRLSLELVVWFWTREKARAAEAALHDMFGDRTLEGEWFEYSPWDLVGQVPSYLSYWAGRS